MWLVPSFMETLPNDLQVLSCHKKKIKTTYHKQTYNDKIVAIGNKK